MNNTENKKTLILFQEEKNPMQSAREEKKFSGVITDNHEYFDYDEINMGWTGSTNTIKQIKLKFHTLEDAKEFAKKYDYNLIIKKRDENDKTEEQKKSYFDNFRKKFC